MTEHLKHLEQAFTCYKETGAQVDFENGNLMITDEELLGELGRAAKREYSGF